jgi:hypothetical protein
MRSCENYTKTYLKLPRVTSKGKVIVSFYGKKFPELTLKSVLDQTVHPDQLIITSPDVPKELTDKRVVVVHTLSTDYECLTPLLSPLLREKDGDAKIIIVDSNQVYGKDFIETLVEASEISPDAVIFTKGYNAKKSLEKGEKVRDPYNNDIIDVTGGVLVKPKFFQEDVFNIEGNPKAEKFNLDVFLSSYLKRKGVSEVEIRYDENLREIKTLPHDSQHLISYYATIFPSFN